MNALDIEKMFDPSIPKDVVDVLRTIVRTGLKIGHALGEKANAWIDDLFNNETEF